MAQSVLILEVVFYLRILIFSVDIVERFPVVFNLENIIGVSRYI